MENETSISHNIEPGINSIDKLAGDIMILATQYPMIATTATIQEAIHTLMNSYDGYLSNKRLLYTVHRSMLVVDEKGEFAGILSIRNMIQAITPEKGFKSNRIHEFWDSTKALAKRMVKEVMQESVARVNEKTSLTEVARVMAMHNTRRVLVVDDDNQVIGIVREQELFFEMANIIL